VGSHVGYRRWTSIRLLMKIMSRGRDSVWRLMRSEVILSLLSVMLLIIRPPLHSLVDMMLPSMLLMNRQSSHVMYWRCRLMGRGPNHVRCARTLLPNTHNHSRLVLMHHLLRRLVSWERPGARGHWSSHLLMRPPYTLPMLESHGMMQLSSHLLSRSSQPIFRWG